MRLQEWFDDIAKSFALILDKMSKGDSEDGNEQRRQITFTPLGES